MLFMQRITATFFSCSFGNWIQCSACYQLYNFQRLILFQCTYYSFRITFCWLFCSKVVRLKPCGRPFSSWRTVNMIMWLVVARTMKGMLIPEWTRTQTDPRRKALTRLLHQQKQIANCLLEYSLSRKLKHENIASRGIITFMGWSD